MQQSVTDRLSRVVSRRHAGSRGAPRTARLRPAWILLAAAALLASPALAQDAPTAEAVTPEALARLVPDPWHGLAPSDVTPTFDRSGAATVVAHYDDTEDERASRDLTLALTDLGPYRDAAELVYRADVAAGRATALQVGGYPAYAATDFGDPTLDVFAGRIWVRTDAFGGLIDADALRASVEALPLDAIAALSDAHLATGAHYTPLGFTPGALRHFLPERVLGLPREDGFYAKRHPTGVAWGGFVYGGTHDGQDVRVKLTIWDLGTLAPAAERRLESETNRWRPFTQGGRAGFAERDAPTPRLLLDVGRFRVQLETPGTPGVDTAWLRGAFDDIALDRLTELATLVPAPTPARDPLLGQPELLAPERLGEALPEQLAGYQRGEVESAVRSSRRDPYDTSYASAPYLAPDGSTGFTLSVLDSGLVTQQVKDQEAAMEPVDAGGHPAFRAADPPAVLAVLSDRFVITLRAGNDADAPLPPAGLLSALSELDFAHLAAVLGGG